MTDEGARAARERIEALTIALSVQSLPRAVGSLLQTKLTIPQLKVLTSVVVTERATATSLAQSFEVSLPTMSKLIDRLVAHALLARVPDDGDQRVRLLAVTDRGREVVRSIMASRPELGIDVLSGLSEPELAALETGMRAVHRELQRRGE